MFLTAILDYAGKNDVRPSIFFYIFICCSGDLSDNESDEKPSVAICGGSICILTGLMLKLNTCLFQKCNNIQTDFLVQVTGFDILGRQLLCKYGSKAAAAAEFNKRILMIN